MPIVTCANGHRLNVAEKFAGKKIKCPKCDDVLVVASSGVQHVEPTELGGFPEASNTGFDPFGDLPGLQSSTSSFEGYGLGQVCPA